MKRMTDEQHRQIASALEGPGGRALIEWLRSVETLELGALVVNHERRDECAGRCQALMFVRSELEQAPARVRTAAEKEHGR